MFDTSAAYLGMGFRKEGGGQFFRENFRIVLHFYYQIFSENLGLGFSNPGDGLSKVGGGG